MVNRVKMGTFLKKGEISKSTDDGCGRTVVNVYYNGKNQVKNIAHLVLETFVGPRPDGFECCHWNGDSSNNHILNLRWDTHSNNEKDKFRVDTSHFTGERHYGAKSTKELVKEIRTKYMTGNWSYGKLVKEYKVALGTIAPLILGKTWNYPDFYPEGYVIPKKRTREECFRGVNRWDGKGCKK